MSKNLIVYYSRKGQNYVNDSIVSLKKGNTEIAAATGAALFEIRPARATIRDGLAVRGSVAQNERAQARQAVSEWLAKLGF